MFLIASGLLSSMPMKPCFTPRAFMQICTPVRVFRRFFFDHGAVVAGQIRFAFGAVYDKGVDRFIRRQFYMSRERSAAAAYYAGLLINSTISLLSSCFQSCSAGRPSTHSSLPSASITTAMHLTIILCGIGATLTTLPDVEAWMSACRKASLVPITWPFFLPGRQP